MKHLLNIIVLLSITIKISAQSDTITHIIERGESIEYLATKYGVTDTDIRKWNSNALDLFYTGMEIRILVPKRGAGVAKHSATPHNSYYVSKCKQADNLLNSGEYKKAIKAYSELIDSYSSSLSCTEAYYGRALAYYNRGKWKSAINDFDTVLSSNDCTSSARSQCKSLLAKAQQNREEQLERRGEIWGSLFAAAAVTTAAVVTAKNSSDNNSSYTRGNTSTYSNTKTSSALDIQIPEAFNPERVAKMSQPVYSYDSNGNIMVSNPGFAQALGEMDAEIQKQTQQTSAKLMATGDPYYMAKAKSLQGMAKTNKWTTKIDQQFWSTPMYPEVWAEVHATDNNADSSSDETEIQETRTTSTTSKSITATTERNEKEKTLNNQRATPTKRQSARTTDNKDYDSRQQFHTGDVSSSDYDVIKHNITLYLRDGDKAKVYMTNKDLCRKGATYYIKLNNKYYLVGYSNWSRFNRSISYGANSVYFDM